MNVNEQVAELMKIYFRNYTGDIQPARGQMAGQLQAILKETTYEKLVPLVTAVALDGMMLSRGTLLLAAKKIKDSVSQKPTYTPPAFSAEEMVNHFAIPMPDYVREALKRPRTTPVETQTEQEQ